jgi:hypothetical protein
MASFPLAGAIVVFFGDAVVLLAILGSFFRVKRHAVKSEYLVILLGRASRKSDD